MSWTSIPPLLTFNIEQLSNLIDRIGTTDFDLALLHFVNQVSPVPISEICGYVFSANSTPKNAGWCGIRGDTHSRIDQYTTHLYRKDPTLNRFPDWDTNNENFVQAIFMSNVKNDDYRKHFFERPNFQTEITLVHREKSGWNLAKFFLEEGRITDDVIFNIGKIAALIYPIGKRHALSNESTISDQSRPKALDRLMLLLENRFPQLTQRERQVCAYTILGDSSQKIAAKLNVSRNTVITYRQRAYDRLCISSANILIWDLI